MYLSCLTYTQSPPLRPTSALPSLPSAGGPLPLAHIRFVSFEFCSGTDLFNFLITGPYEKAGRALPFSEPLACHYFTQVLLAIMYLHERGVYHRDIKPENCVLDSHFNLKLTDFGTNKARSTLSCVDTP